MLDIIFDIISGFLFILYGISIITLIYCIFKVLGYLFNCDPNIFGGIGVFLSICLYIGNMMKD